MSRTLIISDKLIIGGAEKLILELVTFAQKNNIQPTVLIIDNYAQEHYDPILKQKGVKVVRTRIVNIKHFRAPLNMLRSVYWLIKLKYLSNYFYDSVQVIGLYNVDKMYDTVRHKHRFFWHITNSAQSHDQTYSYQQRFFEDETDTIVCVNPYQVNELKSHYGEAALKTPMMLFKLFLND